MFVLIKNQNTVTELIGTIQCIVWLLESS